MSHLASDRNKGGSTPKGFIFARATPRVSADDLRTIGLTFTVTGLIVLLAAIGFDCVLFSVMIEGAHSLEMVPTYRLAVDLLPLSLAFTALVGAMTAGAVVYVTGWLGRAYRPAPKDLPLRASYGGGFA